MKKVFFTILISLLCSTLSINAQEIQFQAYDYSCNMDNKGWSPTVPSNALITIDLDKNEVISNILPDNLKLKIYKIEKEQVNGAKVTHLSAYNKRDTKEYWKVSYGYLRNGQIRVFLSFKNCEMKFNVIERKWIVELN